MLTSAPCVAQNLLLNPNFDTGLGSWTGISAATWDTTLDFGGNTPTNGSDRGTAAPASGTFAGTQCVAVTGSQPYSFGGMIYVTDALMWARVDVSWYSSVDCSSGFIVTSFSSPTVVTTGSWVATSGANPVTAPATAQSAAIELNFGNGGAATGSVNFDNVFFAPGASPVALESFSAE